MEVSVPAALAAWLERADVRVGGHRPWDIQVHRPRAFQRILQDGTLGAGESYMDGDWDCPQLDALFERVLRQRLDELPLVSGGLISAWRRWRWLWRNPQSPQRAFVVGQQHYDAGNDLFGRMLDSRWVYSCAYWEQAKTLEQAQWDKLEMICRKLQLAPGQRLLDIGCGFGGLARHAAEHYGVQVVGITVSAQQQTKAREQCQGWPVEIVLQDYRLLQGRFDRVVSVGMFEHVGPRNYAAFFDKVAQLLDPQGLFLLHTIGRDLPTRNTDAWIERYVFPGGHLPCASMLSASAQRRFVLEDWHNFGADYDRTLMAWHANFDAAWPALRSNYGERFGRLWRYYLLSCAGFFRARQGQLWQLVLSPPQRQEVYRSIRLLKPHNTGHHETPFLAGSGHPLSESRLVRSLPQARLGSATEVDSGHGAQPSGFLEPAVGCAATPLASAAGPILGHEC